MSLFRGRLFHGALFSGATFGASDESPDPNQALIYMRLNAGKAGNSPARRAGVNIRQQNNTIITMLANMAAQGVFH